MCPLCSCKSGLLAKKLGRWPIFERWMSVFGRFWSKKVGFRPKIFQKWAAGNPCGTRLYGVSAHFPTFFLN
nr:MAG TPA: myeloid antimicrobial peptide 27 PEPTIDE, CATHELICIDIN, ALPHA HELIX [Caudoviricetes sp.]